MVRVALESRTDPWISLRQESHSADLTTNSGGTATRASVGGLSSKLLKWSDCAIGGTINRTIKRSYNASRPWFSSGVSFDAAINAFSGVSSI